MSSRVEWVRLLIGLKVRLPQSLSQISARMSVEQRRLEAGALERGGDALRAFADAAVELAEREAFALDVLHDAGRHQFGGRVDDAAEHARRRDALRQAAARVDAQHRAALVLAAVAMEVPVGDAVLHRHDDGLGPDQRATGRRRRPRADAPSSPGRRDPARRRPRSRRSPRRRRATCSLPSGAMSLMPRLRIASRLAPRTMKVTSLAREREPRSHQATDGAGTDHCHFHRGRIYGGTTTGDSQTI